MCTEQQSVCDIYYDISISIVSFATLYQNKTLWLACNVFDHNPGYKRELYCYTRLSSELSLLFQKEEKREGKQYSFHFIISDQR